jgi:DNA-binding MarR family transcriptional regulator
MLRHHSAVELVDRAEVSGLVNRQRDKDDHRVVRLRLRSKGAQRLERLSSLHMEELKRLAPQLSELSHGLEPIRRVHGGIAGQPSSAPP